ncbi:Uncharacterised protein [Chlamydia abortus]|nr:Uncharacterised protein [Chlamydia abortus]
MGAPCFKQTHGMSMPDQFGYALLLVFTLSTVLIISSTATILCRSSFGVPVEIAPRAAAVLFFGLSDIGRLVMVGSGAVGELCSLF